MSYVALLTSTASRYSFTIRGALSPTDLVHARGVAFSGFATGAVEVLGDDRGGHDGGDARPVLETPVGAARMACRSQKLLRAAHLLGAQSARASCSARTKQPSIRCHAARTESRHAARSAAHRRSTRTHGAVDPRARLSGKVVCASTESAADIQQHRPATRSPGRAGRRRAIEVAGLHDIISRS